MNKEYTVYFEGKMTVEAEDEKEATQLAYETLGEHPSCLEFNIKTTEEGECAECGGTGEVATDEDDGEGHIMRGVGTAKCECQHD